LSKVCFFVNFPLNLEHPVVLVCAPCSSSPLTSYRI
jgi:hypothetical protein